MTLNASEEFNQQLLTFGWIDYMLFTLLMGVSLAIGVYFGFFNKQDNTTEYFLGGKRMNYWPIAMSILASHISGHTLLGVPTEVYTHGSQYAAIVFTVIFVVLASVYIFLPVFSKLQIPSAYGYLEVRFARPVRLFCSVLYILCGMFSVPIVVYIPALAFSQVTGFTLYTLVSVLCVVCITYTTMGGLKAVVWTDTVQLSITCGGLLVILGLGIKAAGGISEAFRISDEGGRLIFFNMNPSPFERNTFWIMLIGLSIHMISNLSVNQGVVQRSIILMGIGMTLLKLFSVLVGLIIYAFYHDCDPKSIHAIERDDQLFPYYVMEVAGHLPGLPGLFLAGLVSSALSSMSATLNTISGSIYEDFVKGWIPEGPRKETIGANIMKILVVVLGLIGGSLVFIVEHLGTVFQMAISLKALLDGPILGLFVLGMTVPWVKTRGAIVGSSLSLVIMSWLLFMSSWYNSQNLIAKDRLPTSVQGCNYPINETLIPSKPSISPETQVPIIYRLSFMYYTLVGVFITVVIAIFVSVILRETDCNDVNPDHITPFIRRFLPKQRYREVPLNDNVKNIIANGEKKSAS